MQSQLLTNRKMQTSLTTQWLKLSKQLKASNLSLSGYNNLNYDEFT
jgi:hypothetical protein